MKGLLGNPRILKGAASAGSHGLIMLDNYPN